MITVGSLFAGIGGIDLGLERTGGFQTVWQVENDEYATKVLEKHWPKVRRWGDIKTFPPKGDKGFWACDLICGGFPCQDISYAGKGAGLEGERSGLWYEFARVIRTLGPRYVLVENVAALLTRGLDAVLGTLASLGYDAEWHCIPAAAVGAPHIRERVFVLAYAYKNNRTKTKHGSNRRSSAEIQKGAIEVQSRGDFGGFDWWSTKSDVGRVADGVSSELDRLGCLGNAVVPQVAQWIGEMILEREKE